MIKHLNFFGSRVVNRNHRAFSLVEMSLVLLIVAVLIAGIAGGKLLIDNARLASARSATANSPVLFIKDLALWMETTSEKSFINSSPEDNDSISTWYGIGSQAAYKYNATQTTSTNQPLYKERSISGLPSLYFDGVSDSLTISGAAEIVNGRPFTIFTVEKRGAKADHSWVLGATNNIALFAYGYRLGAFQMYLIDGAGGNAMNGGDYPAPSARINCVTFTTGTNNFKFYSNGQLGDGNTYSSFTSGISALSIGSVGGSQFYQGNIGEIIIFNRVLTTKERKDVERYLAKKWRVTINQS